MSRTGFRNKQTFWYALYAGTVETYDEDGYQTGTTTVYGHPVKVSGNISPARGNALTEPFGREEDYDRAILTGDRDIPIDEYSVLWIEREPELDNDGALTINADGEYVTPWDYIVRRVGRGLANFGSTVIAVKKVDVSSGSMLATHPMVDNDENEIVNETDDNIVAAMRIDSV